MLTPDEIVKCRHHLGYLQVSAASTYSLGVPAAVQTQFMIEGSLVKVLPQAEPLLRRLLDRLDKAECKVDQLLDIVLISKAEDVEYDSKAIEKVARIYKISQQALANLLGCPANQWDMREWLQGGMLSVPVNH